MRYRATVTGLLFLVVAAANASDVELKWDNGSPGNMCVWYGSPYWIGNDFDLATLKTSHATLTEIGVFTNPAWPNNKWDGFRVAVWSQQPNEIIWGPIYVSGSGFGAAWRWFPVNYQLPATCVAFIAAMEQTYYYPACDPYYLDTGPAVGHSWKRTTADAWELLSPNANLMLRVRATVGLTYPGVQPASLGRVKAIYE